MKDRGKGGTSQYLYHRQLAHNLAGERKEGIRKGKEMLSLRWLHPGGKVGCKNRVGEGTLLQETNGS